MTRERVNRAIYNEIRREYTRTIRLESGGTVTISGDFSLYDLTPNDREFIGKIADLFSEFEAQLTTASKEGEG